MLKTCPPDWRIFICCDDDLNTYTVAKGWLRANRFSYQIKCTHRHRGSIACRNELTPLVDDGLLYGTDDITFTPAAAELLTQYNTMYGHEGGCLGLRQDKPHNPTGMALLGHDFVGHYPEREVFYPSYWHFGADEVGRLASQLGVLNTTGEVMVRHHQSRDATARLARTFHGRDIAIKNQRIREGLIWGDDHVS